MLAFVHIAPPCGTCSRALEKPVPGMKRPPQPMRSEDHPLGLPGLEERSPICAARVRAANDLYVLVAEILDFLMQASIMWSVENPRNSLFWWKPAMQPIIFHAEVAATHFQHCAYGGERDKWTKLLHFPGGAFASVCRTCPGVSTTHTHAPWGRLASGGFATELEAVYPDGLCAALADVVQKFLNAKELPPLPVVRARGTAQQRRHRPERLVAGRQPRGGAARQLLPEFREVVTVKVPTTTKASICKPGYSWPDTCLSGVAIPAGAKTVRAFFGGSAGADVSHLQLPTRGCIREVDQLAAHDVYIGREHRDHRRRFLAASKWCNPYKLKSCQSVSECIEKFDSYLRSSPRLVSELAELSGKRLLCHCRRGNPCHADALIAAFDEFVLKEPQREATLQVGLPYSVKEFIAAARGLVHPFEDHACSDAVQSSIVFRMTSSTVAVEQFRRNAVAHWQRRAAALQAEEAALHNSMHEDVAGIMKGKALLLMRDMLRAVDFPSTDALIHHLSCGFPLAGEFPATGVFPPSARTPVYDIPDLWRDVEEIRRIVIASCRGTGDDEIDEQLYNITRDEVEKGWLRGPLPEEELRKLGRWVPSRRFPVQQGKCGQSMTTPSPGSMRRSAPSRRLIRPMSITLLPTAAHTPTPWWLTRHTGAAVRALPASRDMQISRAPRWSPRTWISPAPTATSRDALRRRSLQ